MVETSFEPVLTVSASYGAGGSVIAPRLAERLGVPLIDRLLTSSVTDEAAHSEAVAEQAARDRAASTEGLTEWERQASPASGFFAHLARAVGASTLAGPPVALEQDEAELRRQAESDLAPLRAGSGAVVLGRAGAIVLADRPRAYHVRFDGPAARRITAAAQIEDVPPARAADRQVQTDRSRLLWVKRLYRADAADPAWYHLWMDTTVLHLDDTVEVVLDALGRFLGRP